MIETRFIKMLAVIEAGLLLIYGLLLIGGYLIAYVGGTFKAKVTSLATAQNITIDTTQIDSSTSSILGAVESIAGISSAIALAVFVVGIVLLFYALYQSYVRG